MSVLVALSISVVLVGWDLAHGSSERGAAHADPPVPDRSSMPAASASPTATATPAGTSPATEAPAVVLQTGSGTFAFAAEQGPVVGESGVLRRYRVAVEDGMGIAPGEFAVEVEAILADQRSWISGGDVRLQRVGGRDAADFTIYLATPVTSERICREEWLETEQYTNCRLSTGKVVLNLARWLTAIPDYGAPVREYRAYAVNHEVGHQLGHGHEACPGPGLPAPVMQQQTYGLDGCAPNGWPYLGGARYRGPTAAV